MADPKNLALEGLRNRTRPTVNRAVESFAAPTTPATPKTPATPATPAEKEVATIKPVEQFRRTLRLDADANDLVKSFLGMGEGDVSIDVLVEALLLFASEEPESAKERVIEIAKSRASERRERSLRLREQNRKSKST